MTYIGIDASITSTVVCVEQNGVDTYHCFTTAEKLSGWMKHIEPIVRFHHLIYKYPKDYSESEKYKIVNYSATAGKIISIIPEGSVVGMESYSQSSDAGHLIDLVTLGTYIRTALLAHQCELKLYAPMSMKKHACIIAYNNMDSKKVWRNLDGVAGGSFKKHEMIRAMLDKTVGLVSPLSDTIRSRSEELLALKGIPKPYDDCCDAWWAKEIAKKEYLDGK